MKRHMNFKKNQTKLSLKLLQVVCVSTYLCELGSKLNDVHTSQIMVAVLNFLEQTNEEEDD